jgi:hypothetical protein
MGTKNGHDSLRWSSQSTPRELQTMPNLTFVFFQKGASLDSALALVGAGMPSSSASCASEVRSRFRASTAVRTLALSPALANLLYLPKMLTSWP